MNIFRKTLAFLFKGFLALFCLVLLIGVFSSEPKPDNDSEITMASTREERNPTLTLMCVNSKGGIYYIQHDENSIAKMIRRFDGQILYPVGFKTSDWSYSYDKQGRFRDSYSRWTNFRLDRLSAELIIGWEDSRPDRYVFSGNETYDCQAIEPAEFESAEQKAQEMEELKKQKELKAQEETRSKQQF